MLWRNDESIVAIVHHVRQASYFRDHEWPPYAQRICRYAALRCLTVWQHHDICLLKSMYDFMRQKKFLDHRESWIVLERAATTHQFRPTPGYDSMHMRVGISHQFDGANEFSQTLVALHPAEKKTMTVYPVSHRLFIENTQGPMRCHDNGLFKTLIG